MALIKRITGFVFVLFGLTQNASSQTNCELKKSQDGIFIYVCKVPSSNLKLVKAHFTINTKESILAAHLMDVKNYTHWQYHNMKTEVIKKISNSEIIYHSHVSAPWPVTNRDLVMHLKISQDIATKIMTVEIDGLPDYIPPQRDFVRVPSTHARWTVTPIGKDLLDINYTLLIDPGGSIPVWIVNMALANGPYETFRNLKARISTTNEITPLASFVD